jgi:phosphoglucomutase
VRTLCAEFGTSHYTRIDSPIAPEKKSQLAKIDSAAVRASELAGDQIVAKITRAPGNGAPIGGTKVATVNGWFAVRPSGTENIYKIYAESFRDQAHLDAIVEQAKVIVDDALASRWPTGFFCR